MNLFRMIFNNFWAKAVTLILAVVTWFYLFDLVHTDYKQIETIEDVLSRLNFVSKTVPVKPVFAGESPAGYSIVYENVKIVPDMITIFGPKSVLDRVDRLETDSIELSEYTRSTVLKLGVKSNFKLLRMSDKMVEVTLPVEKAGSK